VYCVAPWDPDGAGPQPAVVVAGGNFDHVGTAALSYVGVYDGRSWRSAGGGVDGGVRAASVYIPPGATSPQAVIGGVFAHEIGVGTVLNGIARFDGARWQPFGAGVSAGSFPFPTVHCAAQYSGGLAIGGIFTTAGTASVLGVARWDGASWSAFPDQTAGSPEVLAFLGGALYAGGYWSQSQTTIFRWSDPQWTSVGTNPPQDDVLAVAVYQGQLVIGGDFVLSPGPHIARYTGTSWQTLGGGIDGPVQSLCVFSPSGPGTQPELLIAGGSFGAAGGVPAGDIAAWNGSSWSGLGSGTSGTVRAMTVWNNQLVVAGSFFSAGGLTSPGMAFWGCPQAQPCYANCDGSTAQPLLNVADFSCFLQQFASGCSGPWPCYPNCDDSTTPPFLNVADFTCFLRRFATGCH
jgi:hypothetical protein